jgi:hypothetical protein
MMWKLVAVVLALIVPPLLLRLFGQSLTGKALGIPYDFRPPTPGRLKDTLWNRSTTDLLVPHVYGWGYSLNLRAVGHRLGILGS